MAITVFTALGKLADGVLNWFFNLGSVWQLIFFALMILGGVAIYLYVRGR